jgi:hypothetical protein
MLGRRRSTFTWPGSTATFLRCRRSGECLFPGVRRSSTTQATAELLQTVLCRPTQRVLAGRCHPCRHIGRFCLRSVERHRRPLPFVCGIKGLSEHSVERRGANAARCGREMGISGVVLERQRCHLHCLLRGWSIRYGSRASLARHQREALPALSSRDLRQGGEISPDPEEVLAAQETIANKKQLQRDLDRFVTDDNEVVRIGASDARPHSTPSAPGSSPTPLDPRSTARDTASGVTRSTSPGR